MLTNLKNIGTNFILLLGKRYRIWLYILILLVLCGVGYYLYNQYYLVIYQETLIDYTTIQNKAVKLNTVLYESVVKNLNNKKQVDFNQLENLKNPFHPY